MAVVRTQIRALGRQSYTGPDRFCSLCCEATLRHRRPARRAGSGGAAGERPPGGGRRSRRPGAGLPVCLGQTRLAGPLPGARPLAVAGEHAGSRRAARGPRRRWPGRQSGRCGPRPRPVRTAKTAASARRPAECRGRSVVRPSPWCSVPAGRTRWRPTGRAAIARSAACRGRSARWRRPRSPRSRPCRGAGKMVPMRRWMAPAKRCGLASQVVSGLDHISRSPSTMRKWSMPSLSVTEP